MTSTNSMHYDDSKHSMYSNPGLQSVTSSHAAHEQPYSGQHQRSNSSNGGVYPHHASSALGNSNSRSLNGAREFTSTPVADAYLQTFPAADSTQSHARAALQHQQSHDSDKSDTGDKHHVRIRANSTHRNEACPQYKHQQYTLPRHGAAAGQLSDASSSSGYSRQSQQSAAPNHNSLRSVSSMTNHMSNLHIRTSSATDVNAAALHHTQRDSASGGVAPTLNTARLRPIRQITRIAVVNILA